MGFSFHQYLPSLPSLPDCDEREARTNKSKNNVLDNVGGIGDGDCVEVEGSCGVEVGARNGGEHGSLFFLTEELCQRQI